MSLTLGAHLGPYEILAAIGAGGMGQVYRARDAKLNRDVARLAVLKRPDVVEQNRDKVVFVFNFFDELRRVAPIGNSVSHSREVDR